MKKLLKEDKFASTLIMTILSLFILCGVTYIHSKYNSARAATYYYGSTGDAIYKIQDKLKRWRYYDGSIDGVYGYKTYVAVKKFQQKNGLKADGVAGPATLKALGMPTGTTTYSGSNQEIQLLARAINGEARGEPYEGQVAVGAVILNRVKHPDFPSSVAGVVYQPGAFTAIADGQINAQMEPESMKAARDALNGWDPSGNAIYYYNPAKTTNKWIWSRPIIKVIGKHRFCK